MKNELDKMLKTTYHKEYVPTDYLNQIVLRNVKECENMGQSNDSEKKIKPRHGSNIKKFAKVAAIILFLSCAGYIGARAAGYAKPISEIFQSIFHTDKDTEELANSMGHFVGEAQIHDGIKITQNAVIGDGYTYAFVFDIEKEDGTAFDFTKDIFDENGLILKNSDNVAEKCVRFKTSNEDTTWNYNSFSSHFYDEDPTDPSIQMIAIYEFENVTKSAPLTQSFTDLEFYDTKKDDTSLIAKGTWEFTCTLDTAILSKATFENQDATIGSLSATEGSGVISPLQYTLVFTIKNEDFNTSYEEIDADGMNIGVYNLILDVQKQGIYLNMKDGEKIEITNEVEIQHSSDDEGDVYGTITIHKKFDKLIPVEQIESIAIGDQTIEVQNK